MYKGYLTKKGCCLVTASILALTSTGAAMAQVAPGAKPAANTDTDTVVVVTGSRIATTAKMSARSPTPLTAVTSEQLLKTTPTDIPDGLNKLPVFAGSTTPLRAGSGSGAIAQNILDLRNFGQQRTLVLFDGQRVTPSNSNGTVDIDTLPQILMSRVDVVTGGASAVYGSDAVTGVVNFVLDTKFTGFKTDINAGVSTYGDGKSYKVDLAGGWSLLNGRGHLLVSAGQRGTDPVLNYARPAGPDSYYLTGNGLTAATEYVATDNARSSNNATGGLILACKTACPNAVGQQFISNGVLAPFVLGTPTQTANVASGGDGAYNPYADALVGTRNDEFFSRFSYDLNDSTTAYVQGTYATADAKGWHFPVKVSSPENTFFKNNPFLPAAVQTALGNNGTNSLTTNTFTLGEYILDGGQGNQIGSELNNKYGSFNTGIDGRLGDYKWNAYYTHGENDQTIVTFNNTNTQKMFAALDAVPGPNGTVVCYASTQAATAAQYANCVPLNPFGPSAISNGAFSYFNQTTSYVTTNVMDDVGASITGKAFDDWAGPIDVALSAEGRANRYKVNGSAQSTNTVNCTGLRICTPGTLLYSQATVSNVSAKDNVWEVAAEADVPLLKDLPLVESLDANLATRYTDYSASGPVNTWKVGLSYKIDDNFRIRATESRDIRAPTLADLYQPLSAGTSVNYTDLHTGVTGPVTTETQGNPNLKPEVGFTSTIGVVFTPQFLTNFSASLDYYKIKMDNAIGTVNGTTPQIEQLCEASGGNSPYCTLYQRPLPFSNTTAANFPTVVENEGLNIALQEIQGYDIEFNYHHKLLGGNVTARLLGNYQPQDITQAYTGAQINFVTGPDTRVTAFLTYDRGPYSVSLEDRWLSSYSQVQYTGQFWAQPIIPSFNTVDLDIERKVTVDGTSGTVYLNVQNLFNAQPPIVASTGGIGVVYPNYVGESIMGAYFTIGFRAKM